MHHILIYFAIARTSRAPADAPEPEPAPASAIEAEKNQARADTCILFLSMEIKLEAARDSREYFS